MKIENFKLKTNNKGVTLLEVLFSIAILASLSLIGIWYFSQANAEQALEKDRQGVVAILREARSLALSSKEALTYGVHIEEFQTVLFKGSTYNAGEVENRVQTLNSKVHIDNISITGGGSDIVFSRLTGETLNDGTIRLSLINNSLSSTTITIENTGVIK